MKDRAIRRSRECCEFCGNQSFAFDFHHRWYPRNDTMNNLMAVCRKCHESIHFGGKISAKAGSLAAKGDTGKGDSLKWREYLKSK